MNKQEFIDRKEQLDVAIKNTIQSLNILEGHKNEMQYWIDKLSQREIDSKDEDLENF
jgi:hypothetical protein